MPTLGRVRMLLFFLPSFNILHLVQRGRGERDSPCLVAPLLTLLATRQYSDAADTGYLLLRVVKEHAEEYERERERALAVSLLSRARCTL